MIKGIFTRIMSRWLWQLYNDCEPWGYCPACGGRHVQQFRGKPLMSCEEFKLLPSRDSRNYT